MLSHFISFAFGSFYNNFHCSFQLLINSFFTLLVLKKTLHGTGQVQLSPDHFIATGVVCFTKGREIKGSENHDHLSGLSSAVFFIQIDFRLDWMPQLCGQQSCYFVSKQQRNFSVVMSGSVYPRNGKLPSLRHIDLPSWYSKKFAYEHI